MASTPWYIKRGPTRQSVAHSEVDIADHLGESHVYVTAWANGEGYDIHLTRTNPPQPEQRFEVTDCEWRALCKAMRAVREKEDELIRERRNAPEIGNAVNSWPSQDKAKPRRKRR